LYDKYVTKSNRNANRKQKTEDRRQKLGLPAPSEVEGSLPKEQKTEIWERGRFGLFGQNKDNPHRLFCKTKPISIRTK